MNGMKPVLICLDMEGVLVPEIWPELAARLALPALTVTSLDAPDLTALNLRRIEILREAGITLEEVKAAVARIEPFDGAREFLDALRDLAQVVIISDAAMPFTEIALRKLGSPHVFCNFFELSSDGELVGFHRRIREKSDDVRALQAMGYETIACGDSAADVSMILASRAGFLFRSRPNVREAHPEILHVTEYAELLEKIRAEVTR